MSLTPGWLTVRLNLQYSIQADVQVLISQSRIYLSLITFPRVYTAVKLIRFCSVVQSRPLCFFWIWASSRGLRCRQMSDAVYDWH